MSPVGGQAHAHVVVFYAPSLVGWLNSLVLSSKPQMEPGGQVCRLSGKLKSGKNNTGE